MYYQNYLCIILQIKFQMFYIDLNFKSLTNFLYFFIYIFLFKCKPFSILFLLLIDNK